MIFERYWVFSLACIVVGLLMGRMIIRQRVTLQASLSFLSVLAAGALFANFPNATAWIAERTGFTIPSNFLFAVAIASLAFLHVSTLAQISRTQLRSITLTQEVALLQERIDAINTRLESKRDSAT